MDTFYIDKPDENLKRIFSKAYPGYNGRSFQIRSSESVSVHDYWDGGSRTYCRFINLETLEMLSSDDMLKAQGTKQTVGNPFNVPMGTVTLSPNIAAVQHCYFCGKDTGLRLILHPSNAAAMLPKPIELSPLQKVVLVATRTRKSSYNGIKNYRFREAARYTGITLDKWESTKNELISEGYLNARGAITTKGKNAVSISDDLWKMKGILGN